MLLSTQDRGGALRPAQRPRAPPLPPGAFSRACGRSCAGCARPSFADRGPRAAIIERLAAEGHRHASQPGLVSGRRHRERARPGSSMPKIELNGARIAYAATGSGETVLLLHATASAGAQWQALAERLASDCRRRGAGSLRLWRERPLARRRSLRACRRKRRWPMRCWRMPFRRRITAPSTSSATPMAAPSLFASRCSSRSGCAASS